MCLKTENINLDINNNSILEDVTITLNRGEMVGLIGPNGAGKTSLLKCILGLLEVKSGSISVDNKNIDDLILKERAKKMAYFAQGAPIYWPLTVENVVGLGRVPHLNQWQKISEDDEKIIESAMEKTNCISLKGRLVTSLSGGERARVLLARALATRAPYIMADEPIASLDPAHQLQVMEILKKLSKNNNGVMVVMHDLSLALRYCDRLILLDSGKLIGQDTPDIILSDDKLASVFGIRASRWTDSGEDFLITHQVNEET
ncbi:MAG: ABC transporter ATP-binding protein [Kordiimonadaceae bacterium]|nr:ABC transporter ATP-binding protein [Kordiimonadaceae bacterium]